MKKIIYLLLLLLGFSSKAFAATLRFCNEPSCRGGTARPIGGTASVSSNKKSINWELLNLKNQQNQPTNTNVAIQITQTDVTQLASTGNSWVVFGGATNVMNMNIGTAKNYAPQTWSLPSNFQEYFDYYTQDDFVAPSSVPAHLQIVGATNITKSTYVDENDTEFDVYEHYSIASNGVNHLGRSFDFDIDDDAFDDPDYEFMNVPLSLNDVMTNTIDEYDYETDQLLERYVNTLTIDAYGTLTIPNYGTYDCLRGTYQTQYYTRPNETSAFVLQATYNSIGFMTKQGHFFQAKIVSQSGSNAVLANLSFKAIVPTASLNSLSDVKLNNDSQGVSINSTNAVAHPSAILDIDNDSKGILIPRILAENRPTSPAEGLLVYQVDGDTGFYYFDGTAWNRLSSSPTSSMVNQTLAGFRTLPTLNTGSSQLSNGSAFIKFDSPQENFEDLIINIQLEGDCNGVFISKKTRDGFEIKELKKGKSNVKFSWQFR